MENVISLRIMVLWFSLFFLGCSKDDPVMEMQDDPVFENTENYFTAKIDGEDFTINALSGTMIVKKQLSEYGSINLSIIARTNQGEIMEFLILNYMGEKSYFFGNNFTNESYVYYSQSSLPGNWRSGIKINNFSDYPSSITISIDNGTNIKGNFTFEGYNKSNKSSKLFTEGDFNIML